MESSFTNWLESPNGIAVLCLLALNTVFVVLWMRSYRTAVKKWEAGLATLLGSWGLPTWFIDPISDLAVSDYAGAIGAFEKAKAQAATPAGEAQIFTGIAAAAHANPGRWAAIMQVVNDYQSGASQATIDIDMAAAVKADSTLAKFTAPPTPFAVLKSDIQSAVSTVQSAVGSNLGLTDISTMFGNAGLSHLFPLVAAGAQVATPTAAPANSTSPASDATAKSLT
jgi:hypothetical protein